MTWLDVGFLAIAIGALVLAGDNLRVAFKAIEAGKAAIRTAEFANQVSKIWEQKYHEARFGVPRKNIKERVS